MSIQTVSMILGEGAKREDSSDVPSAVLVDSQRLHEALWGMFLFLRAGRLSLFLPYPLLWGLRLL